MGTWGTGYFEDDAALDFMADIEESTDPKRTLAKAFAVAIKNDYIESDEGTAVIVAAAYVDRQVNGTRFSDDRNGQQLHVDTFPERNPSTNLFDLKSKAVAALNKVLGENSELNELWKESDDSYSEWLINVEQLVARLSK